MLDQENIKWATRSISLKIDDAVGQQTRPELRVPLALCAIAEALMLLAGVLREKETG